ncbi:MAG TPA: hypothetical protein VL156_10595 [Terriglobales bacterium]|jgi:hypothetical protein|nr:hypothetical protein [Terriglobales bacterium]
MSAARTNSSKWMAPEIAHVMYQRALAVGILFGALSLGLAIYPYTREQFFHSYLLGFMFWLGITLGSMAFLMIQYLTGGMWGMVIRRPLEAAMKALPLMGALFVPIAVGIPYLYSGYGDSHGWFNAVPSDGHLWDLSRAYMQRWGHGQFLFLDGVIGRAIIYFVIWILMAWTLIRWSNEQDAPPIENLSPRFRRLAAPGLILYAFTISFAAIDWVMSLDPRWFSTIFGFIIIVGECLAAMCLMVIVETVLSREEPFSLWLKPKEVHDHGKLILTFIMLHAYFSFSQLLIIWAGNLPMEIRFFLRRLEHGWGWVGLFLVLFHFSVPFALLLSRPLKRNPYRLVKIAGWLLFARFVDLFWYIEPTWNESFTWHWGYLIDIVVPVAIGGMWLAYFFHNLRQRPLLPEYDLHAQEFLDYAGVAHD